MSCGGRYSYIPIQQRIEKLGLGEENVQGSDQKEGNSRSGRWTQLDLTQGSLLSTNRWDYPRVLPESCPTLQGRVRVGALSQVGHICYTPVAYAITIGPNYITRGCRGLCKAGCAGRGGGGGGLCLSKRVLPWTPRHRAFPTPTPSPAATLGPKATPATSAAAATTARTAARAAAGARVAAGAGLPARAGPPARARQATAAYLATRARVQALAHQ